MFSDLELGYLGAEGFETANPVAVLYMVDSARCQWRVAVTTASPEVWQLQVQFLPDTEHAETYCDVVGPAHVILPAVTRHIHAIRTDEPVRA